jgi:hypothetical protein
MSTQTSGTICRATLVAFQRFMAASLRECTHQIVDCALHDLVEIIALKLMRDGQAIFGKIVVRILSLRSLRF